MMISQEDKEDLLSIDDAEVFQFTLFNIVDKQYFYDIDNWDIDIRNHFLKLCGMTLEELKEEAGDNDAESSSSFS